MLIALVTAEAPLASLAPLATSAGAPAAPFPAGWAIGGVALGIALGAGVMFALTRGGIRRATREAEDIRARAKADAEATAERAALDAERTALERKEKVDAELDAKRSEHRDTERRLAKREDMLDRREDKLATKEGAIADREGALDQRDQALTKSQQDAEELIEQQTRELHRVSQLDPSQAKELVLQRVEDRSRAEVAKLVRELQEKAEEDAEENAREVLLQAIQRYATETTSDATVRTVDIPSDDMKGRIIGREGRNIRAIEKATGVDIIVDDTPGVILVSCFDKVRQAIAVEALSRLVADGRMHPTRIEEVVDKVTKEINDKVLKAGKDAAVEVNLRGFHPKVIEAMGKLHYRTSYAQNVLRHSIEVAYFSQIIAEQLGLDGRLARRCGFLHDIGKAMDHEMEGGHPAIGMNFAKQYGEKEEAVLNAIGGHHADIPSTTYYTPIVMAADAVSSARPGARRESMERYVQRLNELQDIALSQPGVVEAHAIQAGREVRVMIDADRVSDDEAYLIAHDIAKRVSEEMTFPGEVRVTVLRETRAIEVAR